MMSPCSRPTAAAKAVRSSIRAPNDGSSCVIQASEPGFAPLQRHRYRSDSQLEHELVPSSRDDAFIRQRERRPDRRMTGQRQLVAGREDPHLHVAGPLRAGSTKVVSE